MITGAASRTVILIGGGPSTGDTLYMLEDTGEIVVTNCINRVGVSQPPPLETKEVPPVRRLSWKEQQRRLPKFLR